ncbi:methanogenesis marker 3 protein [Methanogenium sp. S4BF]|uniref:methyl-coenzyme M reductase-associated protein Mmp3 n=1 Tax=Methanogenium sp. S4BF TaxID=1789226 RepID=UPI00241665FA|nr:methanogenesis marker 3 protein [Methanogenium sp. S4BF]WFN34676.1 methanogenesis marker 3 protein [Methanogenium sp. S4BF]
MTEIRLDGERLEVPEGTLLGDLIPGHPTECSVAVIRPADTTSAATRNIRVTTTAGEIVIEMNDDIPSILQKIISAGAPDTGTHPEIMILKWADRQAASFGPFPTNYIPERSPHRYDRGDVILGCGGYDPGQSYLLFSKAPHIADHGAAGGGGIIGRIVSGMSVLEEWKPKDAITSMERIVQSADTSNAFTTTARDVVLEDGMSIITCVRARAAGYRNGEIDTTRAQSVEHLLLTYRTGRYHVSLDASTHVRDDRMRESEVFYEGEPHSRFEGTITTRVSGRNRGSVFIYTDDIAGSPNHTAVGSVEHGIELAHIAGHGETFLFTVEPGQFDIRGMALSDAKAVAENRGITLNTDDETGERIVISQAPETTLEVLAGNEVSVTTIPATQVISVELFDDKAPLSCYIFRSVTGLRWHEIGEMPLIMHFEDVSLFQPRIKKGTNINKENTPEGSVPANMLAITNDSRKSAGLIGCRTTENSEFGPTSEPFEGTNIIGRVCEPEKLPALKEGSIVYIREVTR